MNKFTSILAAVSFSLLSFVTVAKTYDYEVYFLDTYDQLVPKVTKPGLFYVRDAAGVSGKGGDPTVKEGWAVYTWDKGTGASIGGWKKVAAYDTFVSNPITLEMIDRIYVRKAVYETDLKAIRNLVSESENRSKNYTDSTVSNAIAIGKSHIKSAIAVAKAESAADATAKADAAIYTAKTNTDFIAEETLDFAKKYTDQKVVGVYQLKGACNFDELPTTNKIGDVWIILDRGKTQYAWVSVSGTEQWIDFGKTDISGLATHEEVISAKNSAIASAALDATTKKSEAIAESIRQAGELDKVVEQGANEYTDSKLASQKKYIDDADESTLSSAKIHAENYTNERVSSLSNKVSTVSAKDGDPMIVSNFNAKTGKWVIENIKDYGVRIGDNTSSTANSGSHNQSIVIGRDARTSGAASVAVGPNSEADGAQGVAVGWRAAAIGDHSVAIGGGISSGQSYWKDETRTEKNPNANLTLAEKEESIAIGHGANSVADKAIQLGKGTNNIPNSVQIGNVTIFKDGKLVGVGGVDTNAVKEIAEKIAKDEAINAVNESLELKTKFDPVKTEVYFSEEISMTCMPHVVNTLIATSNFTAETIINIIPFGSRNYELFIPNTKYTREGLPFTINSEIDSSKLVFVGGKNTVCSLPVVVKIQQPVDDVVMATSNELNDGFDWKPVVSKVNIKFDIDKNKFVTDGDKSLEGTSLQAATEFKIVYPTSTSTTSTNDLITVESNGICFGTYFGYVVGVDFAPSADKLIYIDGSGKSWFKIIYKTVNGEIEPITKNIDILK